MNKLNGQAHHYATILVKNIGQHGMHSAESIARFSLKLVDAIERGLTEKEVMAAATGESPATEEPVDDTTDPYTEIDKAIERYMPDWSKAPEWANWYSINENGLSIWYSHRPESSEHGYWHNGSSIKNKYVAHRSLPATPFWKHLVYSRPSLSQRDERPITGRHGPECTCTEEDEKAFIELLQEAPLLRIILALGLSN